MRRRALLSTLGAVAISGCASQGTPDETAATTDRSTTTDPGTTPTSKTTDDRTTTGEDETDAPSPPNGREWASIVDLATVPRTYALTPTSRYTADDGRLQFAFQATATNDHPVVLRAWLRNENPYRNTFDLEDLPAFGRNTSRNPHAFGHRHDSYSFRNELLLAPTDANPLSDASPAVERDADGVWRARTLDDWGVETLTLDAGEHAFGEYYVVGHPDGAGLGRPTGVYEFFSTGDADVQIGVWDTDSPGPTADSRFAGRDVPAHAEGRTAWYHDADETTTAFLEPSTERGRLPEQVQFTIVNKSRSALQCGHWNLYKLDDGEWFHLTPYVHTADCRILAPGRTKTYTLNAYHGEALGAVGYDELGANVGWLGAGTYALVAGYAPDGGGNGALVELTGERRSIVPTEDATATRDGSTVHVRTPEHDVDREGNQPATLTLERATDASQRLVPEQVMRDRFRGLRNTLAYLDADVDAVVLETSRDVAESVVGYDDESLRFRFEGTAYRVVLTTDSP